jgi:hypothetical protein
MGMSASQARFLGLTARKTNVEYEGQQINQQRTALSNQTASYYTNLLGMNVPQPPAVQDYTKTTYSFTDGSLNNQLTSMIAHADGSYTVSYARTYMDHDAIVSAVPSRIVKNDDGTFSVGGVKLNAMGDDTDRVANDPYYASLSNDAKAKLLEEEEAILKELQENWSQNNTDNWLVKYTQNSSTGVYEPTYYNESVLAGATYDSTNTSVSYIGAYTRGSAQVTDEIKGVTAFLEQDSTGRYINVTMSDANGNMTTYALTTATVTDDDAYNDAMNQYEYDKAQYDRDIQEINAKIEIIQSEDKDLELRLKQLDTEQAAITNELEAVNKVIEKNVESSFKTFG